jgi:dihydrolipoamide dehydrogenase
VVKEIKVKLGDTLSEGAWSPCWTPKRPRRPRPHRRRPAAGSAAGDAVAPRAGPVLAARAAGQWPHRRHRMRMVVLGAGPGGYTAAFRAADLGLDTVLVERYAASAASASTWAAFRPRRCCTRRR